MPIGIWGKPAQLDIQPYDRDFMLRAADAVQKRADAQETELSNLSGIASTIQGGYRTQDRAKVYRGKVLEQVNSMYNDMQKTGNIPGGAYKIKQLAEKIKSDPEYQTIKQDEAAKPYAAELRLKPGFENHVQDFYDQNSGWKEAQGNFDPSWYQSVAPGDTKEFEPYFHRIEAQITKEYADVGIPVSTYTDARGLTHVQNKYTGNVIKTITPDQVSGLFKNLAEKDPSFQGLQTFNYDKARFNKEARVAGYDQTWEGTSPANRMAEIATANFLGYKQDYQEATPIFKDEVTGQATPVGTKTSSASSGSTNYDNLYPNPIIDAVNDVDNTGQGTIKDIKAMALVAGGSEPDKKEGTFKLNTTGKQIFLHIADPTLAPEEAKQNSDLINIGGAYQGLKNKLPVTTNKEIEQYYRKQNPKFTNISVDERAGSVYGQTYSGEGTFRSTKSVLLGGIADARESIKREKVKTLPEYAVLANKARALGVDMNDPDFISKTETAAKDPKSALLYDLSIGIQNSKGTLNFRPLAENNLFAGNDGKDNIAGTAEVGQTQLYNMFGGDKKEAESKVKEALEMGLITRTKDATDKHEAMYEVPVNTPVNIDIPSSTKTYYTTGAEDERVQGALQGQRAAEFHADRIAKNTAYNEYKPIVTNSLPQLNDNINTNLSVLEKYDKSTAQELLKKYTSTIEQLQNTTDKDLERRLYTYLSKIFSVIKDSLKEKGEKMINIGYNPVYNNAKSPNYYE